MSLFTAELKRRINEYYPSLGDRAPGMGTGGLLGVIERMFSSVANGKGASQIGVEDSGANFTGTTVEAVLAELYTAATTGGSDAITDTNTYYTTDTVDGGFDALGVQIGGLTDATFGFAEENVLADDDAVYAGLEKLDLKWGDLASVANAEGAALVGVEDAAGSIVAADVEAALAELATPLTLTPGAESGEAIAVVVAGPAHVAQYLAEVLDADMLLILAAGDKKLSETGDGAEVSTTAKPSLLFTTDAAGAATITCTDSGASSDTVYVKVTPLSASAGAKAGPPAIVAITFAA